MLQSATVSSVRTFDDALADIDAIRGQIARGTEFRGYGPASIAASGVLALVAALEARWFAIASFEVLAFLATWGASVAIVVFTGAETLVRARREHVGLARK